MVEVSLDTLVRLMIGTGEGYFFGLSLELPHVSPLESPNHGVYMPKTLLGVPLWL